MAISFSARTKLRRFCVWQKYLLPLAEVLLVWVLSALPLWRFSNGDGTIRQNQSLINLLRQTDASVKATLAKKSIEASDELLAKSLRPLPYIYWILMAVVTLSAFVLFCFAAAALSKEPESPACNRVKVKFRLLFPGKLWHLLLPVLTALPLAIPYYILNRFETYYAVVGTTETESGGQTFSYYTYILHTNGPSPLLIAGIVAGIILVLYFAVKPWERSQKMDLYRYFEPEEAPEGAVGKRNRRG